MAVSTHSTIHFRFKNFVAWIAPEESTREAIKKQADEIRARIKPKAEAYGLTVAEMPFSGSFAKKTGLRRHLQGSSEIEGQDVDIAFILEPKDSKGSALGCQVQNFKRWLAESYPGSEIGETKSSATIDFKSTKLGYDIVPLIKTDRPHIQALIRTDLVLRQSSVILHKAFVRQRNAQSNALQGVVSYNQCVRLIKWWRYEQQSKSRLFGNGDNDKHVPSFLIDLLCAKAFDECKVEKTYPDTMAKWFGYMAHLVDQRQTIAFKDYYTTSPSKGAALWYVADPVDVKNNIVEKWSDAMIDELAEWLKNAKAKMIQAVRKDGEADNNGSLTALVEIFGNAFKNHCD